jgi:hypothetical protein
VKIYAQKVGWKNDGTGRSQQELSNVAFWAVSYETLRTDDDNQQILWGFNKEDVGLPKDYEATGLKFVLRLEQHEGFSWRDIQRFFQNRAVLFKSVSLYEAGHKFEQQLKRKENEARKAKIASESGSSFLFTIWHQNAVGQETKTQFPVFGISVDTFTHEFYDKLIDLLGGRKYAKLGLDALDPYGSGQENGFVIDGPLEVGYPEKVAAAFREIVRTRFKLKTGEISSDQ